MEGQLESEGRGALGEEGVEPRSSWGLAQEGNKWWRGGGIQPARGGMPMQGSPIRQVAAAQVRLIFLITEDLAVSQDQGGQF